MRRLQRTIALLLALGLCNCMGAGMLVRSGARQIWGDDKEPNKRIEALQEKALAEAHGGSPGVPVVWHDAASGIDGAFLLQPGPDTPSNCRRYRQTITLAGQSLEGETSACEKAGGSWKLQDR